MMDVFDVLRSTIQDLGEDLNGLFSSLFPFIAVLFACELAVAGFDRASLTASLVGTASSAMSLAISLFTFRHLIERRGESIVLSGRTVFFYLFVSLLLGSIIGIGLMLLVLPGLILLALTYLAPLLTVNEKLDPIDAISRSVKLSKAALWPLTVLMLVFMLMWALLLGPVFYLSSLVPKPLLLAPLYATINVVLTIFGAGLMVNIYYRLSASAD